MRTVSQDYAPVGVAPIVGVYPPVPRTMGSGVIGPRRSNIAHHRRGARRPPILRYDAPLYPNAADIMIDDCFRRP
jgi:hypothetical protein